ncbi:hypothetical protein DL96DRAFT_701738 [Flagelloscypha sp. PMI_526]|nr:hypothetical protein DL96DRAFT_701738 [Flagelloscypha sp. PMI_526]
MTLFHDHFNTRNQQAFQRLLASSIEASSSSSHGPSKSPGSPNSTSWKKPSSLKLSSLGYALPDINARDFLGRTVLHLACSAQALECTEYVRLLLKHPHIQVNLPDRESLWTPLHRALYNGNIDTALVLLQYPDVDTRAKDLEGYTPFDLYNSTVEGPKPSSVVGLPPKTDIFDLYTWGANRNAALGHGDAADRAHPDLVTIPFHPNKAAQINEGTAIKTRFSVLRVKQIAMSKLHTVVVTDEPSEMNLRVCGFGSSGRLGSSQHTQYALAPLSNAPRITVARVAVGQDHTLVITSNGEVYTWGMNRFSQLGYIIESATKGEEQIQATPKRILGPLRKERLVGAAASRCASCAWTESGELFTWGTNHGQLGYDRHAQPVQIQPRKATRIIRAVTDVAMTDSAMACLVETQDIICVWKDMHFKINFPSNGVLNALQPYRPPQSTRTNRVEIKKVVASEDGSFAALSEIGEVFVFAVPLHTDTTLTKEDIKPQIVWALRKQFTSVKDVALGAEGSIILCTESGHVFVRDRSAFVKGRNASGKWTRVPYIQRVVGVAANSTGSFAVLKRSFIPDKIKLSGPAIHHDMLHVAPFLYVPREISSPEAGADVLAVKNPSHLSAFTFPIDHTAPISSSDDEDAAILSDIRSVSALARFLQRPSPGNFAMSADILLRGDAVHIPSHRTILASRSKVFAAILAGGRIPTDKISGISVKFQPSTFRGLPVIILSNTQPFTILLLLHYLYTDNIPALWDIRVLSLSSPSLSSIKLRGGAEGVRREVTILAKMLDLPALLKAVEGASKRVSDGTLAANFSYLFDAAQTSEIVKGPLRPDVVLHLADRKIFTHSIILRARSPMFQAMFEDPVWTVRRRKSDQRPLEINLRHHTWHTMQYVLKFLLYGEENLFDILSFVKTIDDIVEFAFDIMSIATELLLDRLVLLCCQLIQRYTTFHNTCYILTDAAHFHAMPLVDSVHSYITANLETFLEAHILYDLPLSAIKNLSRFIRQKQEEKMNLGKMRDIIQNATRKHAEWLELEDFPEPVVRTTRFKVKESPRMSPSLIRKRSSMMLVPSSPLQPPTEQTPMLVDIPRLSRDEDIFTMDEPELPSQASNPASVGALSAAPVWKTPLAPRVDMKSLLSEEAVQTPQASSDSPLGLKFSQRPSQRERKAQAGTSHLPPTLPPTAPPSTPPRPAASPWRAIPAAQPTSLSSPSTNLTPQSTSIHRPPLATPPRPSASGPRHDLGPMLAPARQSPSRPKESIRRTASGGQKAWTSPPADPTPSSSSTQVSGGMSFIAIQQLQLEQENPRQSDKRSLIEIQKEEAERQEEADFLKWWAEEEARVKLENDNLNAAVKASTSSNSRKKKRKGGGPPPGKSGERALPISDAKAPGPSRPKQQKGRPSKTSVEQL